YADASRHFAPRTTRNYFRAVTKLFKFVEFTLDEKKLEDIELPRPQDLQDEYPSNEIIRAILNASTFRIRGFLQVMIDTGFEPTDTAQLKLSDVKFEENPPRIAKNRQKTRHKLEGFRSKTTFDTLK